jgi:sialic acid synthase SpsE
MPAEFKINDTWVGHDHPPYIIAEIGINHQGDVGFASEMIRKAKECGANAVKFQTFRADNLVSKKHDIKNWELFSDVELSFDEFEVLKGVADRAEIDFISTPFGIEEADFLHSIGVPAIKIASGDLTYYPLLRHVSDFGLPMIVSTGMANAREVSWALNFISESKAHETRIAILQCTSLYPTEIRDVNLNVIGDYKNTYGIRTVIGFSDHTVGTWAAPAAVAVGARIIEKHFTLDKTLPGDDHVLAADPNELKRIVESCNNVYHSLGKYTKERCGGEEGKVEIMRRAIYASRDLKKGQHLSMDDFKIVRPTAICIEAFEYEYALTSGRINRDIAKDEPIKLSDFS